MQESGFLQLCAPRFHEPDLLVCTDVHVIVAMNNQHIQQRVRGVQACLTAEGAERGWMQPRAWVFTVDTECTWWISSFVKTSTALRLQCSGAKWVVLLDEILLMIPFLNSGKSSHNGTFTLLAHSANWVQKTVCSPVCEFGIRYTSHCSKDLNLLEIKIYVLLCVCRHLIGKRNIGFLSKISYQRSYLSF